MSYFATLSTKEHYGLRLLIRLAKTYYDKTPVSLAEISKQEEISVKYLEQLVVPFKYAKWVQSRRGRDGGYVMVVDPAKLSLKDFVWLVDIEPCLVKCLSKHAPECKHEVVCASKKAWEKVQKDLEDSLDSVKIGDLVGG